MHTNQLKLISLNTAGRTRYVDAQIKLLLAREPSLVALQEVTRRSVPDFREAFGDAGFYVDDSLRLGDVPQNGPRRFGVLIASQWRLKAKAPCPLVPWPERLLSATVRSPFGAIDVHSSHVPCGSVHGRLKIDTLKAIRVLLGHRAATHRILCGDFNTPQAETVDGRTVTWAWRQIADQDWVLDRSRGIEWDEVELSILRGLEDDDLVDVFRRVHGFRVAEHSWATTQNQVGRRYDHVFASTALQPVQCRYLHEFRVSGLSDHSAIEAVFEPEALARAA